MVAVHHPGLGNGLPDGLHGTSGLFSFEFDGSVDIARFADALRFFKLGVSWGGHESLVVPAQVVRVQAAGPNSAIDFGVSERVVRLHVGLEGQDTLARRSLASHQGGEDELDEPSSGAVEHV